MKKQLVILFWSQSPRYVRLTLTWSHQKHVCPCAAHGAEVAWPFTLLITDFACHWLKLKCAEAAKQRSRNNLAVLLLEIEQSRQRRQLYKLPQYPVVYAPSRATKRGKVALGQFLLIRVTAEAFVIVSAHSILNGHKLHKYIFNIRLCLNMKLIYMCLSEKK